MAPIRRYLRITKYSVLEVRIYLDKPSDAPWLLSTPRNSAPILRRILDAVRPHVLPKLREENEHSRAKSVSGGRKKKRGIKDVVVQDDFDVTIFLTELSTRHSLLTKRKDFAEKRTERLKGKGKGLAGWLNAGTEREDAIRIRDEEDEDGGTVDLRDIPEAADGDAEDADRDEALSVGSSDDDFFQTQRERRSKRRKQAEGDDTASTIDALAQGGESDGADADDKKKLSLKTSYDGFAIYGRILCLVVKRKGPKTTSASATFSGSQMMEQWVSTQAAQEAGLVEDDDG